MVQRILVPFQGDGAGTGELTWGQREVWRELRFTGAPLNMGGVDPVPAGMTVADFVTMLRLLVQRHPSLRTRFLVDDEGRPCRQVLSDAGEIPLEIVDTDGDPAATAEAVRRRYKGKPFDYPNEWPLRMALVRRNGELTHVVVMYSHLALDGFSLQQVLVPELANLATAEPNRGMSTLEQARQQATDTARRQSDGALRHWTKALRTVPAARFRASATVTDRRYWDAAYRSPATRLAAHAIAARGRAEPTPVLLAAFAITLAAVTGRHPIVVQVLVSNRFRPGFADTVSPIAQTGLCVLDVAGIPFDEAVGRARQASIVASMNAYYDPDQRERLIAAAERDRGEDIDLSCFFNHRALPRAGPMPAVDDDELRDALAHSALTWDAPTVKRNERLFLSIDDQPDRMDYSVSVDTRFFSLADTEALVRGMESLLVSAAVDHRSRATPSA
ncbi:MAG TPA: condensation domain-containing protein [Pseudonocardiaceae bacterium]